MAKSRKPFTPKPVEKSASDRLGEFVKRNKIRPDIGAEIRSHRARQRCLGTFVGGYGTKWDD